MGILAVQPSAKATLDFSEKELLEAFAVLIGTILQKEHLFQGMQQAEMRATTERLQLQRALLQSVSHELKTPLSAVQAGIEALAPRSRRAAQSSGLTGESISAASSAPRNQ